VAPAFSRAAARSAADARARGAAGAQSPRAAFSAAPGSVLPDGVSGLFTGAAVAALVVLMIVPDGFDYGALATDGAPTYGGTLSRLLWLALLGAGLTALAWRASLARSLLRWLNPFLLVFIVLAAASIAWSIDPLVTARRLIRVVAIVAVALAFGLIAWHPRRFQNVLRPVVTAMLAGSLVFGVTRPELAIHQETSGVLAGAWHGLASHKNGLGDLACVGLILWLHAWLSRETRPLFAMLGAGLATACLYLSRSSTSLVAMGLALLFLLLLLGLPSALRRYMPWLVALFAGVLVTISLVLLRILPGLHTLLTPVGALTGKDLTLTGRSEIWDLMLDHIGQQPYLGTGYGAYWARSDQGTPSFEFVLKLGFDPGSAHNGYLEVLNDLGALGLGVLLLYLVVFVLQAVRLMRSDHAQAALFLALFLQQAVANLTESRWFSALSVDFVIMTLATVALARALLERHRRQLSDALRHHASAIASSAVRTSPHPVVRP
jgi:O-antigen ligase